MNITSFERQNKELKAEKKSSTHKNRKKHQSMGSDVEYDNGNISPLYSNWDQVCILDVCARGQPFLIRFFGLGNAGTFASAPALHNRASKIVRLLSTWRYNGFRLVAFGQPIGALVFRA